MKTIKKGKKVVPAGRAAGEDDCENEEDEGEENEEDEGEENEEDEGEENEEGEDEEDTGEEEDTGDEDEKSGSKGVKDKKSGSKAIAKERRRCAEIQSLCRKFDLDPSPYISKGTPLQEVRNIVLKKLENSHKPGSAGDVRVTADKEDKYRAAVSDGILLRAGMPPKEPAEGAKDFRGLRLRDIAVDTLLRAGVSGAHRLNDEDLFRRSVLTPDSAFASILDNTVNKTIAKAYQAAPTTYQAWVGFGSNPDFKGATHYQISEAGNLERIPQGGEFKRDEMVDRGVQKSLATFGRTFGFTREAMINDDLGILTRVPEAYARAAKRGINKLVYKALCSNPVVFDMKELFSAEHNNVAATAGVPTVDTLGAAREAMRKQKNIRGEEILNIPATYLIVPAALETVSEQLLMSFTDPSQSNPNVINPFTNKFKIISDAEIDEYSRTAWYIAASAADIDTIEVTYLKGDDSLKVESRPVWERLGYEWRVYTDYGVTVLDYRGLYKNAGV